MADLRFSLPGAETVTMSGETAGRLIRNGDGDAALLYIYILLSRGSSGAEAAAQALGKSQDEILVSMRALSRMGLVTLDEDTPPPVREELPEYSVEDIRRELERGSAFKQLVGEVQQLLGRVMSSDDLLKLFGIYDSLGLPPEVILQLVSYCIGESRRRTSGEHMPTMRYIEKAAYEWERLGIFTLEAADSYIKEREHRRSALSQVRRAIGITDRSLSATERKYIENWLTLGFKPEAIAIAYDRTVSKTGKLAWRYMDTIINSWHSRGIHSPEEIAARDSGRKSSAQKQSSAERPAPSAEELEQARRLLRKMKEE